MPVPKKLGRSKNSKIRKHVAWRPEIVGALNARRKELDRDFSWAANYYVELGLAAEAKGRDAA